MSNKSLMAASQAVVNAIHDAENADKYIQYSGGGRERNPAKVATYISAMDLSVSWAFANSKPTGQAEIEHELSAMVQELLPQMIATAVERIKARVETARNALAREMAVVEHTPTK